MTIGMLFAQLRGEGPQEIKRDYFEANGSFTVIKEEHPKPGLVILPGFDQELLQRQKQVDQLVCQQCGHHQSQHEKKCSNCGNEYWIPAIE
jgi:uncharacterized membrane protein YcaP (DUF421 family)